MQKKLEIIIKKNKKNLQLIGNFLKEGRKGGREGVREGEREGQYEGKRKNTCLSNSGQRENKNYNCRVFGY